MVLGTTLTANASLYKKLPFDPEKDLRPISIVTTSGSMLVVHPTIPVSSVGEFVAFAKAAAAKKEPIAYASGGNGTPGHMVMEYFRVHAGFEAIHAPYRGNTSMVVDLVAGQVKVGFVTSSGMIDHVQGGRLRALGVARPSRSPLVLDVPTIAELGYPDFRAETITVLLAPAGLPETIAALLEREVQAALKLPDVIERFRVMDTSPSGVTGVEVRERLKADREAWARVVCGGRHAPRLKACIVTHCQDRAMLPGQASRTLLRVAIRRAAHQLLDRPLIFNDPVVVRLVPEALERENRDAVEDQGAPDGKLFRLWFATRTRFAEDRLARAAARGVRQYVILGAGLDTFPWRQPDFARSMQIFFTDHPASLVWIRTRLRERGISKPSNLNFVPVDLEEERLATQLAACGFDPTLATFCSALGVTQYLDRGSVDALFGFVAGLSHGSEIVFSFAPTDDELSGDDLGAVATAVT